MPWLYQDIVFVWTVVISRHCLCMTVVISRHCLCIEIGNIKKLFIYRQWLYQDIAYVWTVVISRDCLCINSGYIKKLDMYGQR